MKTVDRSSRSTRHHRYQTEVETSGPTILSDADVAHAMAQGFTDLLNRVENVRSARLRLQKEGDPLAEREVEPRPMPLPTVERENKAAHGMNMISLREPSGRFVSTRRERSPIEAHAKAFTEDEIHTAALFVRDAELATSANITAAYDGAPRGVSGPRRGGVPDKHRDAHTRFMAVWHGMSDGYRQVAKHLVLEVRHEATGATASVAEIGSQMCGVRDKATSRGVGIGLLKATLWRIAELYRRERPTYRSEG